MKNLKNIMIAAALLAGSLVSCHKFLEETPKSQEPADAFYQTDNQVQSAVNALYTANNGPVSFYTARSFDATWVFTLDNMAGMSKNHVQQSPDIKYFSSLTQTPELVSNYVGSMWSSLYASINNCNTIIAQVEKNGGELSAAVKSQGLATARFFRAFNYYFLVRLFGKVPIVTQPVSSLEDIFPVRSAVEDVYKLITDDLEWALANGNLADVPMGSNGNRISKGTVACVLSEAYLTMAGNPLNKGREYYQKALAKAQAVINNDAYKLFDHSGGTTPFDKLRLTQFDKGSEYLYFVEYDPAIRACGYPSFSFPSSFPKPIPNSPVQFKYPATILCWEPQPPLLNLYDNTGNDIRRRNRQFFHDIFPYSNSGKQYSIKLEFISPFRWYDSTAIFGTGSSGKYIAVYRLADVLLIAAEAANELDANDPMYITYINPILSRAYVTPPDIPAGRTERRNLVLAERFRELAMEGHTWFDMLRTRLYPDADAQHKVTFSPLIGHDNGRGQSYKEKDMLLPLPPSEMQRNPNLRPQNPGYD